MYEVRVYSSIKSIKFSSAKSARMLFLLVISFLTIGIGHHDIYPQSSYFEELKTQISGLYSSFTGSFTLISNSGQVESGKIYYQYPNKLRVKLSDGRLIITDGRFLWMCRPAILTCVKQDVGGSSGGVIAFLENYIGEKQGERYVFTSDGDEEIKKLIISTQKGMLRSVKFDTGSGEYTVNFLNLTINTGLRTSLFYFKDANTQIIENPLNN